VGAGSERGPRTLAVDVGGSGIKAMVLDARGEPLDERTRVPTPEPATVAAVLGAIARLARAHRPFDRVSVGFPGVVRDGVTHTAVNLHPQWLGVDLASRLRARLGKPVRVGNDADVQGLGVVSGRGVELVVTLGTGVGSALFVDGRLVPNLELGHHPLRHGETYEERLGQEALDRVGKRRWNRRLAAATRHLESLFNYDRLYLGGGNARLVTVELPPNVSLVSNAAGLLGGIALWERPDDRSRRRARRRAGA
jgi:polyphosphate glucokinase